MMSVFKTSDLNVDEKTLKKMIKTAYSGIS